MDRVIKARPALFACVAWRVGSVRVEPQSRAKERIVDLAIVESGAEVDGVVIALHGVTDSAATMADLAAHWGSRWKVICVDLPSHGLSPRLDAEALADPIGSAVAEVRRVVARWLYWSRDHQVVLYGHSMGGAIATALAIKHPQWVRGLVLEDPAILTPEQEERYRAEGAQRSARNARALADPIAEARVQLTEHPNCSTAELGGWLQAKAQFDPAFTNAGKVGITGRELLMKLTMPTLLVTGDQADCLFDEAALTAAREANPMITTAVVHGASHVVHRDDLTAFLQVCDDFMAHLPPVIGEQVAEAGQSSETGNPAAES